MGIRPIDANALLTIFKDKYCDVVAGRYPFNVVVYDLVRITEQQPTIDYEPVRHGEWEWDTLDVYMCSACGEKSHVKEVIGRPDWDYCPNCGAKMDGGNKDG